MSKIISDNYLKEQKRLHDIYNYGTASIAHAPNIKKLFEQNKFKSISDFGAGKKNLEKELNRLGCKNFEYFPYDPVFPEYGQPVLSDLVCCIDVMEHIEEPYLDNVLNEIKKITKKICYFSISTVPAKKNLSDGSNAHILQKPARWWLPKLCERFNILFLNLSPSGFVVICGSL